MRANLRRATATTGPIASRTLRHAAVILLACALLALLPLRGEGARHDDATPVTATPLDADNLTVDDLVTALTGRGLSVEQTGAQVRQPFFAVPAELLRVNGEDLQVFVYPAAVDRAADAGQIGPNGSTIGRTQVDWNRPPHFSETGNLLVLLLSDDDRLAAEVERATLSLGSDGTPMAPPVASPVASPATGSAAVNDLVVALRAEGLTVEETDETVRQAFFTVPATLLRVEGADLQVFVYPDVASRETDAAQIGPDGTSVGTTMITWIAPPHFASAGTILTLLLTDDDALAARVGRVVTALG